MFGNALRTHSRLRVLTATRVALPATRSIGSLVSCRTAVPKNVSLSVFRSFTTSQVCNGSEGASQVARNESEDASQVAHTELNDGASQAVHNESEESTSQVARNESEEGASQVACNESEDGASQVARNESEDGASQVTRNESEDGASQVARNESEDNASQVVHNESEDGASQVVRNESEDGASQVARNESEDSASGAAPKRKVISNTIFGGNVPWRTTEDELIKVLSEFGQVTGLRLHMFQDGRPRGTFHADFASKDSVVAIVESAAKKPIHIGGRNLRLDFAAGNSRPPVTDPNEKLYFYGCAGDESAIRAIFQRFNDSISYVFLLRNPRNGERTKGGFIQFKNIEAAKEAREALNGTQTPDGEQLDVSYARPLRSILRSKKSRNQLGSK